MKSKILILSVFAASIGLTIVVTAFAKASNLSGNGCPEGYEPYTNDTCVSPRTGPYDMNKVIFKDGARSNHCRAVFGILTC